jgi:hypothetical protein
MAWGKATTTRTQLRLPIRLSPSPSDPLHRAHAHASGVSPGRITTVAGPSPMPAPALLEAINRNSLAIFLAGICLSHSSRRYTNAWVQCTGEHSDWHSEPVDADDVCVGRTCDVCVGRVCLLRECFRVGCVRTTNLEVVKRTGGKNGPVGWARTRSRRQRGVTNDKQSLAFPGCDKPGHAKRTQRKSPA